MRTQTPSGFPYVDRPLFITPRWVGQEIERLDAESCGIRADAFERFYGPDDDGSRAAQVRAQILTGLHAPRQSR